MTAHHDYALTDASSERAIADGLALAQWYVTDVPREKLQALLVRKNGPAIRDTTIWFSILIISGVSGLLLWGSWWAALPFAIYGVVYASSSDSRWHESSHGTAFKTPWMNDVLYEIASFMIFREATPWRWSHARHHSDTLIRGRDQEIAVKRPTDFFGLFLSFFSLKRMQTELRNMLLHAVGKVTEAERTFVPESEFSRVFISARIYLAIYGSVITLAIATDSLLPLMYIGLPTLYGSWLLPVYGTPQHAGLAENVLDHRLNSRTMYMNRLNRFLYWNMNYHLEHHMFPLVPYHALPQLHELVKHDLPKPYEGLVDVYREIIPALIRQAQDPEYYVQRPLPTPAPKTAESASEDIIATDSLPDDLGWLEICDSDDLDLNDVKRFDFGDQSYAIYRTTNGYYATAGYCTHGQTHLAGGLLIDNLIECPKHNGRFDIRDGSAQRKPPRVALCTYPTRIDHGKLYLKLDTSGEE